MYAIFEVSGKQEKVEKGSQFLVNRIDKKEGSTTKLGNILFAKDGNSYKVGKPHLKDASVECEVVSHVRSKKVVAFKYRRRKSYHRKVGHRQDQTLLKVKSIKV